MTGSAGLGWINESQVRGMSNNALAVGGEGIIGEEDCVMSKQGKVRDGPSSRGPTQM